LVFFLFKLKKKINDDAIISGKDLRFVMTFKICRDFFRVLVNIYFKYLHFTAAHTKGVYLHEVIVSMITLYLRMMGLLKR
jgi:hypothetical protein